MGIGHLENRKTVPMHKIWCIAITNFLLVQLTMNILYVADFKAQKWDFLDHLYHKPKLTFSEFHYHIFFDVTITLITASV